MRTAESPVSSRDPGFLDQGVWIFAGVISPEDQSLASAPLGDSMARKNAPELGSPTLRRHTQATAPPLLTAQETAGFSHTPDVPRTGPTVGGAVGPEQLSAGAVAASSAEGPDGPARRKLVFETPALEGASLSGRDAAVEDFAPGRAAVVMEMHAEESINDEDSSGGDVKAAGSPAGAAGPSVIGDTLLALHRALCPLCGSHVRLCVTPEHTVSSIAATGTKVKAKRRRESLLSSELTAETSAKASKKGRVQG